MQNISLTSAKQPRFVTLLWLVLVFCFFHFSCSDSGTDPKPKPPGYQEDIPWPSLADSPWPMYRADPQNTGRTEYPGPLKGHIKWTIDSVFIATSGVAVGPDSTIYFVSTKGVDSSLTGLIALNPNGEVKWVFPIEPFASKQLVSPVVAKDGTIYFSSTFGDNKFYAINPNGTIKWQIDDVEVDQIGININKDGTLYFMTNTNTIFCVNKNGTILWSVKNDNLSGSQNGMGISPDGKTLYIQGIPFQNAIHAFDLESKSIKWSFGKDRSNTQPVIDSNGNI